MIRRAVLFPVAVIAVVLILRPVGPALAGLGWAFIGGMVLESGIGLWETASRERRYLDWAEELREWEAVLDDRARSLPSATFGTPARELDDDGWPAPQTPMTWEPRGAGIEHSQELPRQHGTLGEHQRRTTLMGRPSIPVVDFHRREHDLSRRDRWLLRIDRVTSTRRLDWLFTAVDRIGVWLAVHEPKRFWHDYELGRHAVLRFAPVPAPDIEVPRPVVGPRVVRWVDPVDDETPTLLRFDFDTAAWSVLDEWRREGLQPVGAP